MTSPLIIQSLKLPRALPTVLGVGAYLKNALCLIDGDNAFIGAANGSLDNVDAINLFQDRAQSLLDLARNPIRAVAHDWHPDFYCTRYAHETGLRTMAIQHHHAHIASVMAEHGLEEPVIGLALDGFGLGARNEAWGGELLLVDEGGFRRIGHLKALPQPGGDMAARQPWRMGAAALWVMGRGNEIADRYSSFSGAEMLKQMMDKGLNAPLTTSAGRLFDAACGLLNVIPLATFEGEAPIELERMASESTLDIAPESSLYKIEKEGELTVLNMLPLLGRISGMVAVEGAVLFHEVLAAALIKWVKDASQHTGITKIVMGGGCFFNKRLRQRVEDGMMAGGLDPLLTKDLVPGDAAIALGQAYAAALMIDKEKE